MIGVIGLGRMGGGIAKTLLRNRLEICVHDIAPDRVARLSDSGAVAASGIADLCERCETILVSLPNSDVAVRVLEGDVLPNASPDSVVIDMGTTLVRETRRLHTAFKAKGVVLLDAPVSGGESGAAEGKLFIFVGGDRDAARSRWPILQVLGGARLTWCGESGCGQITKVVNQLCMGLVDAAYLEAIAFGVNGGVEASTLGEAIGAESGFRAQLRTMADRVASGNGAGNDVKYAELAYFLDFAQSVSFPTPMLEALFTFMRSFPATARDNMDRPYPPLWSALTPGRS